MNGKNGRVVIANRGLNRLNEGLQTLPELASTSPCFDGKDENRRGIKNVRHDCLESGLDPPQTGRVRRASNFNIPIAIYQEILSDETFCAGRRSVLNSAPVHRGQDRLRVESCHDLLFEADRSSFSYLSCVRIALVSCSLFAISDMEDQPLWTLPLILWGTSPLDDSSILSDSSKNRVAFLRSRNNGLYFHTL